MTAGNGQGFIIINLRACICIYGAPSVSPLPFRRAAPLPSPVICPIGPDGDGSAPQILPSPIRAIKLIPVSRGEDR